MKFMIEKWCCNIIQYRDLNGMIILKFQLLLSTVLYGLCNIVLSLLISLGFYIAFNTVQVISGQVVMWAEETSKLYVTK